jgi:predicted dithiol-disulfide oxidoreductase (DUF899 family)
MPEQGLEPRDADYDGAQALLVWLRTAKSSASSSPLLHLRERDTRFGAVSRGDEKHLQRYREPVGWDFPWHALRDDFDADHDVAEWHGTNVFLRDGDEVYRTYFIDARGDEAPGSTWSFLDITPYGRQEAW